MGMERFDNGFEYKVTVIIPVYNVEQYLEECLDSLLAQTIPQEEMEVLMINDGSPDGILAICERYAVQYENFKVLSQENQGVSAARNNGIRNAKGKYLMYLDSDDTLSPGTVKNVTDFFDKHYDEVDVVTYPLIYRSKSGDSSHWRYTYLKETGIYCLEKFPYVCQTTMNICTKNGADKKYFNEDLKMAEDQTFIIESLVKIGKIGFTNDAKYCYLQHGNNNSKVYNHPYYLAEGIIKFLEYLIEKMQKHLTLRNYLGSMALYNLAWRISGDCLYPYHYSLDEQEYFRTRLSIVIDSIDTRLILGFPDAYMHIAHKYYLLSLKKKNRPFVRAEKDGLWLLDNSGTLLHEQTIQIVVTESKIQNGEFIFGAHVKSNAFNFMEKPLLFAKSGTSELVEIPLEVSQFGCLWSSRLNTNQYWYFRYKFSISKWKKIFFYVNIKGQEIGTTCWFHPMQTIQPSLGRPYIRSNNFCVVYEDGCFSVCDVNDVKVENMKKQFLKTLLLHKRKNWIVRKIATLYGAAQRKIWLYCDSVGVGCDNGYYQFIHDFYKKDGISRYYVTRDLDFAHSEHFDNYHKKHIVEFGSKKHKILYLNCDKIVTAYIEPHNYFPFDWATYNLYRDLKEPEIIYLQHGVLHAHMPYKYSYEKISADYEVVSTHYEIKNMVNNYCFPIQQLIPAGMPRYDYLNSDPSNEKKKILFAPSWRHFLIVYNGNGGWTPQADLFKKSIYYKEIQAFLSSPMLSELLHKYHYELDFKLHPIFSGYRSCFSSKSPFVNIVSGNVDGTSYDIFITDFSSFSFDYVYQKRAIMYFFPDYDMFRAGINDYRELDIPIEDGFGPCALNSKDALIKLEEILACKGQPEGKYLDKMENFFLYYDNKQCDRIYDYISKDK